MAYLLLTFAANRGTIKQKICHSLNLERIFNIKSKSPTMGKSSFNGTLVQKVKVKFMAYIEKRGDAYKIRVSCGYDTNGKQVRQSFTWRPPENMTARQIEKE